MGASDWDIASTIFVSKKGSISQQSVIPMIYIDKSPSFTEFGLGLSVFHLQQKI